MKCKVTECALDHCICGTHDANNEEHICKETNDLDEEIIEAERHAGWDPNP